MTTVEGPYVGLDYFTEEDAGFFFGRNGERKRIIGNLRASRLTLLYAESGVGKSSLLRAGVAARSRRSRGPGVAYPGAAQHVVVVFSTWRGDPTAGLVDALERSVQPLLGDGADHPLRHDGLEHALEDLAAMVDVTPLLILDQFEEHFLYTPGDGDGFDDDLARCITRGDLPAHFLISIREDAYPLLGTRFKARIPNVYGNFLHLDFLDVDAARQAVLEPVRVFNERLRAGEPRYEVESALVGTVLEQVRRGRVSIGDGGPPDVYAPSTAYVETAYLQLVMKRLWDEETSLGSHRLRLETLQRLGGADTIVRGHLDEVMATLPSDQRDAAAAAFRFLVTASGRKMALSTEDLVGFTDTAAESLEPALAHLEVQRILRAVPSPEPGDAPREIYHDVLAPAILDWRRRRVEEQRRADSERRLGEARGRARRLEARNRRLAAAVVALVAIVVGLALYLWEPEPVQRLELRTVDARFSVRGARPPDPQVVLIAVDDRTLARLDPKGIGAIPRDAYARMLDGLRPARPRAIALDVIFLGPQEPRADRALLTAIRAARGRVVLAFDEFVVVPAAGGGNAIRANLFGRPDAARRNGARTGFAGLPEDVDHHNRRADYRVDLVRDVQSADVGADASVTAATFAFAAADTARGGLLRRHVDDLPTASGRAWGGQSERTTWIDYAGPPGTLRRVSAMDLLDDRVPSAAFADKVVVIGVIARGNLDLHRTPLDGGRGLPGPEVQANAISTMLRDEPLRDAPAIIEVLVFALLACLPAVAGMSRSVRVAVALTAAVAVAFLAAAQLAFQGGRIIPVVVPLVAFVVAAAGATAVATMRAVQRRRARAAAGGSGTIR